MYVFSDNAKQAVWDSLITNQNHYFETEILINDVEYGQDRILELITDWRVFNEEQPGVGGCLASELTTKILAPTETIPRMARVEPYVRVTDGTTYSEWMPQGVYYIDTREVTDNDDDLPILTLHCYDAMLMSEADYPNSTHSWPYSDINVVKEIAKAMGLQSSITETTGIDSRTIALMTKGYTLGLPVGYSMREVLSQIAAMYAGNWIMNYDGQLLLVTVNGIPPETNYLIDSTYDAITFGGDRILV